MKAPDKHSPQSDSGDDADHKSRPIIRLEALYEELSKVEQGSPEHKRIQEEFRVVKESMAVHQVCFRTLLNAVDCERVHDLVSIMQVFEKRFMTQVGKLFETDLTWTEFRRLNQFISEEKKAAERQLANSREDEKQAGRRQNDRHGPVAR